MACIIGMDFRTLQLHSVLLSVARVQLSLTTIMILPHLEWKAIAICQHASPWHTMIDREEGSLHHP